MKWSEVEVKWSLSEVKLKWSEDEVKWSLSEVKLTWSEAEVEWSWSEVEVMWSELIQVLCTLWWPCTEGTWLYSISFGYILYCVRFNLYCDGFKLFCNVCVCVCFVMCGCLDNVYTLNLFGYPDWGFSMLFLSCKANARVKPAKTGHGQHSSKLLCVVLFVIRVVLLLIVTFYVLFVCKCVLPPGVNPIAVNISVYQHQYRPYMR
jgi:hypothetical protein